MSLFDYLKAAAGEVSLFSSIGRWMQAVSQQLDSSNASSPDFMYVKRVGDQGQIGVGTSIKFNTIGENQGNLALDGGTGTITLNAGTTYLLRAEGALSAFSDAAAGELDFQWTDTTGTPLQSSGGVDCPKSMMVPTTHTGGGGGSPLAGNSVIEFIYAVPPGATLAQRQVRVTYTSGTGTANPLGGKWYAVVQAIPRAS